MRMNFGGLRGRGGEALEGWIGSLSVIGTGGVVCTLGSSEGGILGSCADVGVVVGMFIGGVTYTLDFVAGF